MFYISHDIIFFYFSNVLHILHLLMLVHLFHYYLTCYITVSLSLCSVSACDVLVFFNLSLYGTMNIL